MQNFTNDTLLGGKVRLRQPVKGYRVAIDPVLLAAFVRAEAGQQICELGCGTGAVLLCLAQRVPDLQMTGLEPDPELRNLAEHNALHAKIVAGAVGSDVWALEERFYDHVMFNPPYFPGGDYAASPYASKTQAHQLNVSLGDWVHAARRALKPNGQVTMILHDSQMTEAVLALQTGFGAVEIKPVRPKAGANATRVLIRAQMGRKTPLNLLPDLVLHDPDGSYSQAAQNVLVDGESLL